MTVVNDDLMAALVFVDPGREDQRAAVRADKREAATMHLHLLDLKLNFAVAGRIAVPGPAPPAGSHDLSRRNSAQLVHVAAGDDDVVSVLVDVGAVGQNDDSAAHGDESNSQPDHSR